MIESECSSLDVGPGLSLRIHCLAEQNFGFVLADAAGYPLDSAWGFYEEAEAARAGKQSVESLVLT